MNANLTILDKLMPAIFEQAYGRKPHWIVRAPGRVNLMGEHTDYNEGFVLPMAIDRYAEIAAAPNGSNIVSFRSTELDGVLELDLAHPIQPTRASDWSNYPRGVIAGFLKAGYKIPGFDALLHSTVPIGGGVSSSAALEVATATLLEAISGTTLEPAAKALLCQQAEHDFAGVPCGIMDQFIATVGRRDHLMLLDCRSREIRQILFDDPTVVVLIINTNIKHELASGEYAVRRQQCETGAADLKLASLRDATLADLEMCRPTMDPVVHRRVRHIISEIHRTTEAARLILDRDWSGVGQLMVESHASMKDDFEISCVELDTVVAIAHGIGRRGGVYGCRMTGGGFGGCAVALIDSAAEPTITCRINAEYRASTGIEPTLFSSRPAAGASIVFQEGAANV